MVVAVDFSYSSFYSSFLLCVCDECVNPLQEFLAKKSAKGPQKELSHSSPSPHDNHLESSLGIPKLS